jgi:hypothetical protein
MVFEKLKTFQSRPYIEEAGPALALLPEMASYLKFGKLELNFSARIGNSRT